jgi:hypothetical protein
MEYIKKYLDTKIIIAFAVVFFSFIAFTVRFAPDDSVKEHFGTISFLFGIFLAFSISTSMTRFNRVVEKLEKEESLLLYIYNISGFLGKETQKHIQVKIEAYLISQIDYFLQDYKNTHKEFMELFLYIVHDVDLQKDDKHKENIYDDILSTFKTLSENRKQIEVAVQNPMTGLEWICINVLLTILLFTIFYMNVGTGISILISILMASTAFTFVMILQELNSLQWKNNKWVWDDLTTLFKELELLPYYPKEIIDSGKYTIQSGNKVRIVTYPHQYPDNSDKRIEIIEV